MDMYCPQCKIVLPPTAQRCTTCGQTATLAPNSVVNHGGESYTIVSVLGIGGMGIVYKATDNLGSDVVVKQLYVDNPADLPDAQRRFRREAQIQAGLNHAAFPRGFGYFSDQGFEFAAMEFVPGQDLEKTLATRPRGQMSDDEALQLGIQICDGLTVLHNFLDPTGTPAPIIHRDIKPANIILRPSDQICILDLGIARAVTQSAATQARATRAGTFEYCSSQQVSGTNMSIRDDIYSLAATLFHLRTGAAFAGDFTQRAAEIDQLPPTWRAAFRRAIHNDTNLRQRNADEFKDDLVNLLPPHLRPVVAGAIPPPLPRAVVPPAAIPVAIRWRISPSHMVNPNEWRQPLAGQVVRGTVPVPGVVITPILTDTGTGAMAVNTTGTIVHSSLHGDFALTVPDVTVPVTVDRREILIIVEDPATGIELCREPLEIDRPGMAKRVQARGAAGVGAVAHGAAAPFRAVGHGVAVGARGLGHGAAVGARGLGQGIAWPFRQIAHGGRVARGWMGTASSANLFVLLALAFFALAAYGVAKDNGYIWSICLWMTIVSWRASSLSRRGKLPGAWKWAVYPPISFLVIGSWLAMAAVHFFAK